MRISPELSRNIWLELSEYRLIAMPAVLTALFFLTYLISNPNHIATLSWVALILFLLLTLLWGTRISSDAVLEEIKDRTWDAQRMSSISPWDMVYGKLLGSTIYIWYGALICLLVYVGTGIQEYHFKIIKTSTILLMCGLLAQGIALLASLQLIRKDRTYNKSMSFLYASIGVILVIPMLNLGLKDDYIVWYDTGYDSVDFIWFSSLVFLAWVLTALHRLMRAELQFRNTPIVWIGFLGFIIAYSSGFNLDMSPADIRLSYYKIFNPYLLLFMLTYIMILLEPKDPILIRRIVVLTRKRDWFRVFGFLPCWLVTAAFFFIFSVVLFVFGTLNQANPNSIPLTQITVTMPLFMLRDIAIITLLNLSTNRRRADIAATFYLAILYLLLPSILTLMELNEVTALFNPFTSDNAIIALCGGVAQTVFIGVLVVRRWHKNYATQSQINR